ncbi:hypothetical protein ACFQ51_49445 [Streptomyces kaempferi]
MIRSAVRALATAPAVLAMAATAVVAAGGSASAAANPGPGFPAHYAAPYVETWNSPSAMTNARNATGLKYYTLAFVIDGGGCNAMFNGDTPVTDAAGPPRSTPCGERAATSSPPSAVPPEPRRHRPVRP